MPVESLSDLAAAASDASDRASAAIADVADVLLTGTVSRGRLANLSATLGGVRDDVRAVRQDLDGIDVSSFQFHARGDRTVALWRWERVLRRSLVQVDADLRASVELTAKVALGIRRKTRVLRSGETLQAIAAQELGDWREWPRILEATGLEAGSIPSGTVLVIPEKR